MAGWGAQVAKATSTEPETVYGRDYYQALFQQKVETVEGTQIRMALVGHENTAKTGLALSFGYTAEDKKAGRKAYIIDFDNSAQSIIDYAHDNDPNIIRLPIHDETDESIFNDDNTVNWLALVHKTQWFVNLIAEQKPEEVACVIFDGGSSFLKICEMAMRNSLIERGIIGDLSDTFNQKEYQERNRLFRDTVNRVHGLPFSKIFFTFHLKAVQQYMDDGSGKKVLMSVGERPEWEKGTMRLFSQQIFLGRYMRKPDPAAGVKADKEMAEGEWKIKATIEEMKGRNMEFLGQTFDVLSVTKEKVQWNGLPMLKW